MSRAANTMHTWDKWDRAEPTPAELKKLMTPVAEEDAWAVVGDMKYLTAETLVIMQQMAIKFHETYPYGEPMYKRHDGYVTFAHTCDVSEVLKVSMRKAQKMLQITRQLLKKDKGDFVSVKEFCMVNRIDEDEFRKGLSLLE